MNLTPPSPAELLEVARKVVWHDSPEETLSNLMTFLPHLMVYGSFEDLAIPNDTCHRKNSGRYLRARLQGCLRARLGKSGMNGLECQLRRCHGAGFQMVRLVRRRDGSLTASYVDE